LKNSALLIIDMQLGNFTGSDPIFKGEELLDSVRKILQIFRSFGVPIIYIQNMGTKGDPDEPGTQGWQIHPAISPLDNEITIQKTSPDSFNKTDLRKKLNSLNILHLYIVGLQTEYCIDTTVRQAYSYDYEVTLIEDAHSTWDSHGLKATQIIDYHNSVLGSWFAEKKKFNEIEL